jgi:hypothetical protein
LWCGCGGCSTVIGSPGCTALAHRLAGRVAAEHRLHEAALEAVELGARVPQAGDLDDRALAEP